MFKETHLILGTRDIQRAIVFYTQRLGFNLAFGDKAGWKIRLTHPSKAKGGAIPCKAA
jgi:catechol 2,3-dioxygenase-like lactoylglutathione lyase family enzyme